MIFPRRARGPPQPARMSLTVTRTEELPATEVNPSPSPQMTTEQSNLSPSFSPSIRALTIRLGVTVPPSLLSVLPEVVSVPSEESLYAIWRDAVQEYTTRVGPASKMGNLENPKEDDRVYRSRTALVCRRTSRTTYKRHFEASSEAFRYVSMKRGNCHYDLTTNTQAVLLSSLSLRCSGETIGGISRSPF